VDVAEHTEDIGGLPIHWRSAGRAAVPAVYVHGVPNASGMWAPFLALTGGLAPDLPGFGRSSKRGDLPFSIDFYDRFLESFLAHLGVDRCSLVMHDWGAVGLALAQRQPERIARLVLIDAVPFLPGFNWHRVGRVWRTRGVGEMVMGATTRWALNRSLPAEIAGEVWPHFDQGTQRAILRLYRSAPPDALARAGRDLAHLDAPALVVWGEDDPYIPSRFADAYAAALPHAETNRVPHAGHWPWLDRIETVERVASWLTPQTTSFRQAR